MLCSTGMRPWRTENTSNTTYPVSILVTYHLTHVFKGKGEEFPFWRSLVTPRLKPCVYLKLCLSPFSRLPLKNLLVEKLHTSPERLAMSRGDGYRQVQEER